MFRTLLEVLDKEAEKKYLGSTYKISNGCGKTFGEIHRSPITSPHRPVELKDGSLVTVYYAHESKDTPAVIMQQKWSFEE